MKALSSPLSLCIHPELATLHHKVTAEAPAPVQPLGQAVVGSVPAAVLHDGQREARKHSVLGVGAGHRLVLKVNISKETKNASQRGTARFP